MSDAGNEKKKKEKDKEKKYQWPHGCREKFFRRNDLIGKGILVTPPLKNVRKRRFRKVARQKTQDHDEIEKEVRRLFRYQFISLRIRKIFKRISSSSDNEAVDVKWEIIDDDQEVEIHKPTDKDPLGIKPIDSFGLFV